MALDLNSYRYVQSNLFVRINLSYTSTIIRLTDSRTSRTIDGESYVAAGNFLGITSTTSEISNPGSELTITLAGVPNSAISDVINSRLKGSSVKVWRGFYDSTGTLLAISGNPAGRFTGIITNYSIQDEQTAETRSGTASISLTCATIVNILANTTKGRRTNPEDQKRFFATDVCMDRVPELVGVYIDWGAGQ
jgi:hypothetical protein